MTSPTELTVATFNIKLGTQQGLAAVCETVASVASPDILAVQEIGVDWLMGPEGDSPSRLSELLKLPHYVFVPTIEQSRPHGPAARYGHALFSRWPIGDHRQLKLPRHEDEPRRLLRCTIAADGDTTLDVLSTHLSHLPSDRPDQGIFLRRWLDDHPLGADARFLLGDLNAPPSETWIADFLDHWVDADADKQRPTFPAHNPRRRIDYVLADGARLIDTTVPRVKEVSDHRPVISRWQIPAGDQLASRSSRS